MLAWSPPTIGQTGATWRKGWWTGLASGLVLTTVDETSIWTGSLTVAAMHLWELPSDTLTTYELQFAERYWIQKVQHEECEEAVTILKAGKRLLRSNKLLAFIQRWIKMMSQWWMRMMSQMPPNHTALKPPFDQVVDWVRACTVIACRANPCCSLSCSPL